MVELKIHVDTSGLNFSEKNIQNFKNKTLESISSNLKNRLITNTPTFSGKGKNNYQVNTSGDISEITNNTYYLPWVNDGTGIYGAYRRPITPKRAGVLVFQWKGRTWFLKSVRGQKPQKFVEKSLEETKERIEGLIVKAANESL